jgi:hypothetical protein
MLRGYVYNAIAVDPACIVIRWPCHELLHQAVKKPMPF